MPEGLNKVVVGEYLLRIFAPVKETQLVFFSIGTTNKIGIEDVVFSSSWIRCADGHVGTHTTPGRHYYISKLDQ